MTWLRRLLFRRTVKGFEHRMNSLENLMDQGAKVMEKLNKQILDLELEKPTPTESIAKLKDEYESWSRIYWDAYNRHDEVETGLMFLLKDYNRR